MRSHSFSLFVLFLTCFVAPALAQTHNFFQWQFANNALSTSLPTCLPMQIIVKPFNATANDTIGVPPYYMLAFAIDGTPITSFIGTDNSSLSWTVTHPVGTKLLLSVVDSQGSAGGIPPSLFTVIAGSTTQCVSDPSTSKDFTVTANVTDTLTTCQPWGMIVKGGAPPYVVTLAAINSPIVTNVTMPFGNDVFTFIDRADPNTQLIAAVSDLTGRWAFGTPIVKTRGSPNVDCTGLVSSTANSTQIQQEADAANAQTSNKTAIIAGVCVTLGVLLLLAGGVVALLYIRRRRQRQAQEEPDIMPRQFEETGGEILSINNFISPPSQTKSQEAGAYGLTSRSASASTGGLSSSYNSSSALVQGSQGGSTSDRRQSDLSSNSRRPGFASFPSAPVRRSAKALVAGAVQSPDSEHAPALDVSSGTSRTRQPLNSSLSRETLEDRPITEGDPVFQHRDAGGLRELPPPYADRGGLDRAP